MDISQITPDEVTIWELGVLRLNATIVFTWVVMALLIIPAWLVSRRLSPGPNVPRWQAALEALIGFTRDQIAEIGSRRLDAILPFVGTLILFIGLANVLAIVPGFLPPTGSLSTTTALAVAVLAAGPIYSIAAVGLSSFLRTYVEPTWLMLPFHLVGDLSRTVALAVRLFGNVMSAGKIVAILLSIIPLLFPVFLSALGLITGLIQAYIFAVLATVYIASGMRAFGSTTDNDNHRRN